jgi:phage terminase large subunit GpA-like protein
LTNPQKLQEITLRFFQALRPPPRLNIWQWADKYRILTSESSSEPGPWRTSRFPFTKEIMECLSPDSPYEEVVWMKGSQVSGTEVAMNWMGYIAHYSPAPTLYIQKTIDAVKKFSKQRLGRMIEACPALKKRFQEEKTKDTENSILMKNFPGGVLILGGANSAASLRSMPICDLCADEIDSYESDIDEEGDPVELAIRRTANFSRRKIYKVSTPAVLETSRIKPAFEAGDMRYFCVPCPHCNEMQQIEWERIKWDGDDHRTARMVCAACHADIPERFKTYMLERGVWVKTHPEREVASFHLSALYSPIGHYKWGDAVKLYLKAKKNNDPALQKVFENTVLGQCWSATGKSIDYTQIQSRAKPYGDVIPANVLVLTAGVDVQEDRLEVEIVGWGKGQESWGIEYARFMGDTEFPQVWQQLAAFLLFARKRADGRYMRPACVGVDSGHRAKTVYNFTRYYHAVNWFPIKGDEGWGKGNIKRPTRPNQEGVMLFILYVDPIKSKIYSHLSPRKGPDNVEVTSGPGYCHFPTDHGYDEDYYRGLTPEVLKPVRYKGHDRLAWELPPGRRNEPLDCRVYATGALYIISPNFDFVESIGGMGIVTLEQGQAAAPAERTGMVHPGEEA